MLAKKSKASEEVRFNFGHNWTLFSKDVTEPLIEQSMENLKRLMQESDMSGKNFLDVGAGSGIHSLAARKLGAQVFSFDYDLKSVKCTQDFKDKYFPGDKHWFITQGSILDEMFVKQLGIFDIVYSWGVMHHSGNMQLAFQNVAHLVKPGGKLVIAIYNDQGLLSDYWKLIKMIYCKSALARFILPLVYWPYFVGFRKVNRWLRNKNNGRGMSLYYDLLDWLGGYPFEVAKPEAVETIFTQLGFQLIDKNLVGNRQGCNEFVFTKNI